MDALVLILAILCLLLAIGIVACFTMLRQATAQNQLLKDKNSEELQARQKADAAFHEAKTDLALTQQRLNQLQQELSEREKLHDDMKKAAIASVADAGQKLSTRLFEEHKREVEEAKKKSDEDTKKVTAPLLEQVQTITDKVAALQSSDTKQDKTLAVLWRALSTPAAVGQFGELGLENTLRQLDLEPERDFIMQYSITNEDGSRLRPDCVIPLPNHCAIVIDSKASRFVLEVAAATDEAKRSQALADLVRTMNDHIKALKTKDYHNAMLNMCKKAGRAQDITQVINVMYLSSETAYFFLQEADRNMIPRAREEHGILILSPTHLYPLIAAAQAEIRQARKAEHQHDIIEMLPKLLEGLAISLGAALTLAKSVRGTAKNFDEFAQSFNHSVLKQIEKLQKMGVHHKKEKQLEVRLPRLEILSTDSIITIESEQPSAALSAPETEVA